MQIPLPIYGQIDTVSKQKIEDLLDSTLDISVNQFATLDFDGTCIINDIQDLLFNYMCRLDLIKQHEILSKTITETIGNTSPHSQVTYSELIFSTYHTLCAKEKYIEAYEFCAKTLHGFTVSEINSLLDEAIQKESDVPGKEILFDSPIKTGFAFYRDILHIIHMCTTKNIAVWIVSGSPQILIDFVIQKYNLHAKGIGVRVTIDNQGIMQPYIDGTGSMFEGKVTCIKEIIDANKRPLFAIGDTLNDLAMLEYSSHAIIRDKGNTLSDIAKERGWLTLIS